MRDGVDIPCTDGVVIGPDVVIGRDCTILPGTILRGRTVIGDGCTVGPEHRAGRTAPSAPAACSTACAGADCTVAAATPDAERRLPKSAT